MQSIFRDINTYAYLYQCVYKLGFQLERKHMAEILHLSSQTCSGLSELRV